MPNSAVHFCSPATCISSGYTYTRSLLALSSTPPPPGHHRTPKHFVLYKEDRSGNAGRSKQGKCSQGDSLGRPLPDETSGRAGAQGEWERVCRGASEHRRQRGKEKSLSRVRLFAILQVRILEWVAVPRGSPPPRDRIQVSRTADS